VLLITSVVVTTSVREAENSTIGNDDDAENYSECDAKDDYEGNTEGVTAVDAEGDTNSP